MENLNHENNNVALINLIKLRERTNSECAVLNEKIIELLEKGMISNLKKDSEFISLSKELISQHEKKSNELNQIDNIISNVLEIDYNKQNNISDNSFKKI